MSDQQHAWVTQPTANAILDGLAGLREHVVAEARAASGDERRPVRAALLDVAFRLDALTDRVRPLLGALARMDAETVRASFPVTQRPRSHRVQP